MNSRNLYSLAIAALLLVTGVLQSPRALAGELDLKSPPQGVFMDDWFIVTIQGGKVGYAHSTTHRDGDRITTTTTTQIEIKRDTAVVSIEMEQVSRELLDGTPVGFDARLNMGGIPIETKGKIRDGKVRIRTTQMGVQQPEIEFPFDPEARLAWGSLLEQTRHGLKPGTTFIMKTYDATSKPDGALEARIEVLGNETIVIDGLKVPSIRVRQTLLLGKAGENAGGIAAAIPALGELASDSWVNSEGTPLVMEMNIGGMLSVRMAKTTKEIASGANDPAEMFNSLMITAKGRIDSEADEITYHIRSTKGPLADLPTTEMQSFKRLDETTGLLTVKRHNWLTHPQVQESAAPAAVYSKSTIYADSTDPSIRKLAAQATADAKSARERVDAIQRFVAKYINEKGLDVGFATASEVCRNRKGDCSEHAVLLAAMLRAEKIPSRGVAGIIRLPKSPDTAAQFGFHMWAQAFVDGQWVDADAAFRQSECSTMHIAIATLDLDDNSLFDIALRIAPMLGTLELSVK